MLETGPSWLVSVHPQRGEVFLWLDFFTINGFMVAWMITVTALLAATTSATAHLSGRVGGDGRFGRRFSELGYQYAPVAMVSLIIGLGAMLFDPIKFAPLGPAAVQMIKGGLYLIGVVWSVWLPIVPGIAGSIVIGACWWPVMFGA